MVFTGALPGPNTAVATALHSAPPSEIAVGFGSAAVAPGVCGTQDTAVSKLRGGAPDCK